MISSKKKGLGRGLKALFGDQKPEEFNKKPEKSIKNLSANISDLIPNKYQPRTHFDENKNPLKNNSKGFIF